MLTAVYSLFREAVVSILLQEQDCPKCPKNKRAWSIKIKLSVILSWQRLTLPPFDSTISAEGLNCSVRNGKRCFPLAIATNISLSVNNRFLFSSTNLYIIIDSRNRYKNLRKLSGH